jgi:hypothetical protein
MDHGWIAIHAAKREPPWVWRLCDTLNLDEWGQAVWRCLDRLGYEAYPQLPRGVLLGMAHLAGVGTTGEIQPAGADDLAFGDWSAGRFAWHIDRVCPFTQPVKCVGRQRLWKWTLRGAPLMDFLRFLD